MAKMKYDAARMQRDLVACAEISKNHQVLDLGWGGQPFCAPLLRTTTPTFFLSDDIRAVRVGKQGLSHCFHAESPCALQQAFDAVFYHPEGHAAKGQVFHWIDSLFEKLNSNGCLYLAGQKDRGVLSYVKYIEAVFGQVSRVGRSGRMQFFKATKITAEPGTMPTDIVQSFNTPNLPCGELIFETRDGVFSRDGIDPGSRLLLDSVTISSGARVLDIGCGYGFLGIACAKMAPQGEVAMVDVSARAVACTTKNIAINKVQNASAGVSDLYEALEGKIFDLILSNPPFHEGNQTAWPLIDGAFERLTPEGALMLVVMRAGAYIKRIEAVFGQADIVAETGGYTVLRAKKRI